MDVEITVFTPTYNRAYIINQLYESLRRQSIYNFEWLVVDDGSVDETEELFARWTKEEGKFPIRYYKKDNGGKCRAINFALDFAKGRLFFIVDSDDYLTDDALEKIITWEKELPKGEKYFPPGLLCLYGGSGALHHPPLHPGLHGRILLRRRHYLFRSGEDHQGPLGEHRGQGCHRGGGHSRQRQHPELSAQAAPGPAPRLHPAVYAAG